jgi:class 3 adenylate cyclase/tetratricopeptide (TPR) repeat protein
MNCPRCETGAPSDAEFCPQCGAKLIAACPQCGTGNAPQHRFCKKCGRPLAPTDHDSRATSRLAPDVYTPTHLAERILTSRAALEGERKQVTVLFADLKGSMELLADRDPEDARKILDPVLEHMMEAVHRYEGTVNQVMGDGIMALFGAPLAHEDHAVRACYAALDMQGAIRRYAEEVRRAHGAKVQIRVGLNSGEVIVRAIGSDLHMDYTAVGQTTHLAARMEQLADPGSTLLTPDTLQLAEGYVEVKSLGPVPVKGLPAPVEVYELLRAGARRSRLHAAAARGLTRFVGRDAELEQLRQSLGRAAASHGQVLAIVGEAGVGKSRLVWEVTHSHRTHGWLILQATSASFGRASPYLPVIGLLRGYFGIDDRDEPRAIREKVMGKLLALDRVLEPMLPALLALLGVPVEDVAWQALDPRQRRERTVDAAKRVLLSESRQQPLLVVFEDLHWIDAETQGLLDSLVESVPSACLLLLVNYRPEYEHRWAGKTYYTQLRLDPLPPESAEELLRSLIGENPALALLARRLVERTEGNPFFLEESVRALVETGALAGESGRRRLAVPLPEIRVPATVQAVLAARMDRLPIEDRQLLQEAAVIGKDVPLALLRAVTELPDDDLRSRLAHLQAGEFLYETSLYPEPEYTFKHALTQEVAYGGLLQERRRTLHARIATALRALAGERRADHAEALARHALNGEVWEVAVDCLREAGVRAFARGAVMESLERLDAALDLLPRLAPGPEAARRGIDVRFGLLQPLFSLGQAPRFARLMDEGRQLALDLADQSRLARVLFGFSVCALFDARYPDVLEAAGRALAIARAEGDGYVRVRSTFVLASAHVLSGDIRVAIDLLTPLVDGADAEVARRTVGIFGTDFIMSCSWLGGCWSYLGDFERAFAYAARGLAEADAIGVPSAQAWASAWQAFPAMLRGEASQALPGLERAVRLSEANGLVMTFRFASCWLGGALAMSGRPAEGLAALERGVSDLEHAGVRMVRSQYLQLWAQALLRAGRLEAAERTAERAIELAAACGERVHHAEAFWVQAEIQLAKPTPRVDLAASLYGEAAALARDIGLRPLLARCHLGLGRLHQIAGRRELACEEFVAAVGMFKEMGMQSRLQQAESELKMLE